MNDKKKNHNGEGQSNQRQNVLQSVIDSPEGLIVFSLDKNYNYTSFSKSHKKTMKLIWGKDIELGQNMLDYILREDDKEKAKQNFDKALNGDSFILDEEYGKGKQRTFWENHYSPIKNEAGVVTGVSVFVVNITKRKKLEEELREKESALKATFYSIGDAVITTDAKGKVVKMNPIAEELCGWKEDEAEGRELSEIFNIVNTFSRKKVENPIEKVMREGKIIGLANHTTLISKNRKEYQIADSAAPIKDKKGNIIGSVLVFRDVTEKYRLESELKARKEFDEAVLQAIPDLLFIINDKYEFIFYSAFHGGEDLLYKKPEDFVGQPLTEILPPEVADEAKNKIDFVLQTKKDESFIYQLLIDGEKKYFVSRLRYKGDNQVLAVVTDITEIKITEHQLEQSKSDFQRIIEFSSVGIVIHAAGKFLYANDAVLKIVGAKSKEEFLKRPVLSFVHPESKELALKRIRRMMETGEPVETVTEKFFTMDGKEIYVSSSATPIFFKGKQAIMLFLTDVTKLIEAEKKIKENEEVFRTLAETTTSAIFVFSKDKFLYVNKTTERITGYSSNELLNMNFWDVVHPDFRELVKKRGQMRVTGKEAPKSYEFKVLNKSGEGIWINFSASIIKWKGKNAALGSAVDITSRKKIELDLMKSEQKYKLISKLATDYIFETEIDAAGNFTTVWVSDSFEKITGYSLKEFKDKGDWGSILHPNDYWIEKESVKNIMNNRVGIAEVRIIRKDGKIIWVRSKGEPIWSDKENRVVGIVGAVSDITERKQMIEELIEARQKAEASERVKSEFLAQMSHEIRSPLNVVLNFISLLKMDCQDDINDDLQTAFSSIDSSSRRIIRTVDLILNMTELQSGTYESIKEEVDVVRQIENVIAEYRQAANIKKLTLELLKEFSGRKIVTDSYALLQTIVNLIDNAIKYTKEGGVTVTVSENKSNDIIVKVRDTGIGISEEYLPEIFSAFTQEEQGYNRKFEGNGLGMALVNKYVRIMKGKISIDSEKGNGTTFTLIIPDLSEK